jgi:hypothetical protein
MAIRFFLFADGTDYAKTADRYQGNSGRMRRSQVYMQVLTIAYGVHWLIIMGGERPLFISRTNTGATCTA